MQQKAKTVGEQIEKDYNTQLQNEAGDLETRLLRRSRKLSRRLLRERSSSSC